MKLINCLIAILLTGVTTLFAAKPTVKIVATAKPNGIADATSLEGFPLKYVAVADKGSNLITQIETTMQFQFVDSVTGLPIDVQDFTVSVARYSLYWNDAVVESWAYQPHGAWNPPGDSASPDLLAHNKVGAQVSINGTQVMGSNIPLVSKVQVLRQSIPLGTIARPLMTKIGDRYGLERFWTFSYSYEGVTYTDQSLPLPETYVEIGVVKDIPDISGTTVDNGPGPFVIEFQVTENLDLWYPVPFHSLSTTPMYPVTAAEFIAWYPPAENLGGKLMNPTRRFYRFAKMIP